MPAVRVLVVDNFDSFTWNLVQALGALGAAPEVVRADRVDPAAVLAARPDRVLISPGPGAPEAAAGSLAVLRAVIGRLPVLGVCLGHQALAVVLGGRVTRGPPIHGKTSPVLHDGTGLFAGLPSPVPVARYHSLLVDPASVPAPLRVTARTEDGRIMGLRHRELPVEGVQFHPESFLTPDGPRMLATFLSPGWAS